MNRFGIPMMFALMFGCSGDTAPSPKVARWDIGEDLAVAVCAECGEILDRSKSACTKCDTPYTIAEKAIDCPGCEGEKRCAHCDGACDLCEGSAKCTVCAGAGTLDGAACPDCAGKKHCAACADKSTCEHCRGSTVCTNCSGSGKITLK